MLPRKDVGTTIADPADICGRGSPPGVGFLGAFYNSRRQLEAFRSSSDAEKLG
jgi:hypothetical protein